jgi:hypothetical protein
VRQSAVAVLFPLNLFIHAMAGFAFTDADHCAGAQKHQSMAQASNFVATSLSFFSHVTKQSQSGSTLSTICGAFIAEILPRMILAL